LWNFFASVEFYTESREFAVRLMRWLPRRELAATGERNRDG
jgi:hypothetical protein